MKGGTRVGQEHISNPFGAFWSTNWRKKNFHYQPTLRLVNFFFVCFLFFVVISIVKASGQAFVFILFAKKVRRGMGHKLNRTLFLRK